VLPDQTQQQEATWYVPFGLNETSPFYWLYSGSFLIFVTVSVCSFSQAPKGKKSKKEVEKAKPVKAVDPLYPPRPRTYGIGGDIRPQGRDLSRFVKWPKYVRIQRQRAVLYQRLKVPPAINQFTKTLNKNEAMTVFTLFNKYRPETPAAKKQRLKEAAAAKAAGKEASGSKAPNVVKFGLKHITSLVEEKKAKLVLIACDVDPIEIVMWMPALCRKMQVPFMIVKDKARLGALVHQKVASCVALTGVDKGDESQLKILTDLANEKYNNNAELVRKWGGGIMGLKTQAKLDKRAKALAAEEAKKLASLGKA
jgi:large subunit ribosomal protein L7Ae